ncbi:hypothetical protein [Plantactinospora sp. B24E8]|uniref:hypothetical protein n=1 Tax=Plantactinospora sp. B24E8 TaxID=3153567 RepID=UPI00325CF8BC
MYDQNTARAAAALLTVVRTDDWEQFVQRIGVPLADVLRQATTALPVPLLRAAVHGADSDVRSALSDNAVLVGVYPRLVAELIGRGSLVLARNAFLHRLPPGRQSRAVFAAADPAVPGWTAPEGPVPALLAHTDPALFRTRTDPALLRAAVVSLFPDLVRQVISVVGTDLTPAEQLRALLSLHDSAGPDAVAAVLAEDRLAPEVADLAREALAGPDGRRRLASATEAAESTRALVDDLRQRESGRKVPGQRRNHSATELVAARTELDWELLHAEYVRQPFRREETVGALASQPDCPKTLLLAILAAPPKVRSASKWAEGLALHALHAGVRGADLLRLARPAVGVLDVAQTNRAASRYPLLDRDSFVSGSRLRTSTWLARWAEFNRELRVLVRDRLGDQVAAWRSLRARLADFTGPVPELIDEALATADHSPAGTSWPDGGDLPDPRRSVTRLPAARSAFLALLNAAEPAAQAALLPHLDDRTAHDLVVTGSLTPALTEWIVTAGSARDRLVLARRKGLAAELIERLLRFDDPEVTTSLFFQDSSTPRQRLVMVVGTPLRPGASGQLPLPSGLRDHLLGKRANSWVTPYSLGCGDPQVVRNVLRYFGVKAGAARLRLMAGLWRRSGPDAVQALLDEDLTVVSGQRTKRFDPALVTLLTRLLAEPDPAVAVERLRAYAVVALLREAAAAPPPPPATEIGLADLLDVEFPSWDWATVRAEHARAPLPGQLLHHLVARPGCPAELVEAKAEADAEATSGGPAGPGMPTGAGTPPAAGAPVAGSTGRRTGESPILRLARGAEVAEVLADTAVDQRPWSGWPARAVREELLRAGDVLRYGHPAVQVLGLAPVAGDPTARTTLAELVAPIDGNLDAWLLVLRLLADFPGALPELVATARLATQPATAGPATR